MIADRNIVVLASNWFAHPTSKQHVMRLLSERNNIVWVNFHASRRPTVSAGDTRVIFSRLKQMLSNRVERVEPTIDVVTPFVVPFPESKAARAFNGWNIARQIKKALRRLPNRPTQLWLFTPDMPELIGQLNFERTVYYCVDDFPAFEGFNTELVTRLEEQTVAAVDMVLATSQPLLERMEAQHSYTHFLPHGVDYDHFASAQQLTENDIPEDVKDIDGPTFGFFGLISDHVDVDLVGEVARQKPDWNFVLMGEERSDTSCCQELPNVRLLGSRPYSELPKYCKAFDVGLIPFRMNRLVHAVNPIKLREYLAAGLPVISSPMPEVMKYQEGVFGAATAEEFINAGEKALEAAKHGDPNRRQAQVANESWRSRVDRISDLAMGAPRRPRRKQVVIPTPA